MIARALIILMLIILPSPALADNISGIPYVIDGDTIIIHEIHIRLSGIDAPESRQVCLDKNSEKYLCGKDAANKLADKINRRPISCMTEKKDRYGRTVATCFIGEENINEWMVFNGWALAYRQYSKAYIMQEEKAMNAKLGIWQGAFEKPWEWRKLQKKHKY